tara:strand:+ start:341 stop:940 length:600 start_codon:yes stop_codon:yes gene_type:complete
MNYQISIIVPVYNREKYVGRCLRSLLSQSMGRENYEIIVVDDGSTDSTMKILKAFEDEIKILKNDKNIGLPASLNLGIKNAKGKYIVRVDSDDYVNVEFLKILYLFIHLNENIDASACDYYLVNDDEKVIKKVNCDQNPIGCGIMFEAQHLISIGLYNENFLLNEEKELRERFVKKYKITRIPLPLYRYRQHDNNMTKQ